MNSTRLSMCAPGEQHKVEYVCPGEQHKVEYVCPW